MATEVMTPAKVTFTMGGEKHTCPFCGGWGMLKLDKKGRPYFSCETCWSRLFIKTQTALEGFGQLSEARAEALQKVRGQDGPTRRRVAHE